RVTQYCSDLPSRFGTGAVTRVLNGWRNDARRESDVHFYVHAADERLRCDVLVSRRHPGGVALQKTRRLGVTRRTRIRYGVSYTAIRRSFADPDPVQPPFEVQKHSLFHPRRPAVRSDILHLQWSRL